MIVINPQSERPVAGTVTGRFPGGYLVRTAGGRSIRAASTETWIIGTQVTVLAGQIIGQSGRAQPSKIYEV
jgi:hypothetical protein